MSRVSSREDSMITRTHEFRGTGAGATPAFVNQPPDCLKVEGFEIAAHGTRLK